MLFYNGRTHVREFDVVVSSPSRKEKWHGEMKISASMAWMWMGERTAKTARRGQRVAELRHPKEEAEPRQLEALASAYRIRLLSLRHNHINDRKDDTKSHLASLCYQSRTHTIRTRYKDVCQLSEYASAQTARRTQTMKFEPRCPADDIDDSNHPWRFAEVSNGSKTLKRFDLTQFKDHMRSSRSIPNFRRA